MAVGGETAASKSLILIFSSPAAIQSALLVNTALYSVSLSIKVQSKMAKLDCLLAYDIIVQDGVKAGLDKIIFEIL